LSECAPRKLIHASVSNLWPVKRLVLVRARRIRGRSRGLPAGGCAVFHMYLHEMACRLRAKRSLAGFLGLRGSFSAIMKSPFQVNSWLAGKIARNLNAEGSREFHSPPVLLMDRRRRRSLSSMHAAAPLPSAMEIRADPRWNRVIDANGLVLAHVVRPT
jgi:hypothetical protein